MVKHLMYIHTGVEFLILFFIMLYFFKILVIFKGGPQRTSSLLKI